MIDFVSKDYIGLENCKYFILDKAKRMLDMGFEPQMRKLAGDHVSDHFSDFSVYSRTI